MSNGKPLALPKSASKAPPKAPGFGKVNPKVGKALENTPQGVLVKILGKAKVPVRKSSSK
jgi:hypothetical protein